MAASTTLVTPQSAALIGYGLLFGGAAIAGKLVIDALMDDVDSAKARRNFIGPIRQKARYDGDKTVHEKARDVVRYLAMGVSIYSMMSELPKLIQQWGIVEGTVRELTK